MSRENHRTGALCGLWPCPAFTLSFYRVGKASENVFAFQVGKSERISSTLMSTAKYSSASATEMRMPHTHGLGALSKEGRTALLAVQAQFAYLVVFQQRQTPWIVSASLPSTDGRPYAVRKNYRTQRSYRRSE